MREATGEQQEPERDGVKRHEDARRLPERPVAPETAHFVPAGEHVVPDEQRSVVQPIGHVVPGRAVPHPHEAHGQEEPEIRRRVNVGEPTSLRGSEDEARVDVIAEPKGERHVPAVPEVADVAREKRSIEVLWSVDAEEVAEADRERAVSSEIEEQIEAVRVHVGKRGRETGAGQCCVHPVLPYEPRHHELVEEAANDPLHGSIQILEEGATAAYRPPIAPEATKAIDGPGGHGREEEEISEVLGGRETTNDAVVDAEYDVEAPERHKRETEELEARARREQRRQLRHGQRRERES